MMHAFHWLGYGWRQHKRPLLFWTIFVCLTFGTILLGIDRLPNGDFSGQFHAFALFQSHEMAAGRLPLWSPGSYGGFPFVADPQAAVFYPLRWLTILGSLPWGFGYHVLEIEGILHIWLAGLFTYLLAYDILRRSDAALISAIVFGLGGYLTSYPLLQLAILETITWLPLILLLLRQAMNQETAVRLRPLLAAGLCLGIAFTAGHPQTFLQISYLIAAYGLYLGWQRGWSPGTLAKVGLLAGLVTLGSAAVAWLPLIAYTQASSRAAVDYSFVSSGLPLEDFLQLFLPGVLSFWTPETVGTGTLLLLLLAWHGRNHLRHTEASFWAGTAVITAILSLGDQGYLFTVLYKLLPGFTLFRSQERWLAYFSFALALLAGFGVLVWQKMSAAERKTAVQRWALVLLVGIVGTAVSFFIAPAFTSRDWQPVFWQRIALLLAFTLLLVKWRWPKWQLWLVALLLAGDLYLATEPGIDRVRQSPQTFWPQPAWLDALHIEETVGRIDSRQIFESNLGEIYNLADIRGISPLKYEKLVRLESLPLPTRWALLNVTHTLQAEPEPGVELTAVAPITASIVPDRSLDATLYRLDTPQPYAWMVYELLPVPDDEAAFNALAAPEFDLQRQVIVTNALTEPVQPPTEPPHIQVQTRRAGFTELVVTTQTPGVLTLSEWDLPGWQVLVDGQPAQALTTNYAFQGIWLPAGTHTVIWRYRPWQVPLGIAISVLVVLGTAVLLRQPRTIPAYQRRPLAWPQPALPQLRLPRPDKRQLWHLSLLLITLIAWMLRVHTAALQELRGDEGFSYMIANNPVSKIIADLVLLGEPHSPLHFLLIHGQIVLGGSSEIAMRLPGLLFGLLLVPLMAEWGRLVAGRRVGVLAALFTAVSQTLIWLSQEVHNQYDVALSCTVLANILLIRACRREKSIWPWLLYGLATAAAVHGHYFAIFILFTHGVYVWFQPQRWKKLRAWVAAGALAASLVLPWPLITSSGLASEQVFASTRVALATYLQVIGESLTTGASFDTPQARWVLLAAFSLMLVGWVWCKNHRRDWAWALAAWMGTAVWAIYLLRFRREVFNDYYLAVIAPGWWLLIAIGIVVLWQQRRTWLAVAGCAIVLGASFLSIHSYYGKPDEYQRYVGYRTIVNEINAAGQPGDLIMLHTPDPAFEYYLHNQTLPRTRQPEDFELSTAAIEANLEDLANRYDRIWFVPAPNNAVDPLNVVPNWLDNYLLNELDVTQQKLRLQVFRTPNNLSEVLRPLDRHLEDWLTLTGYLCLVNGRPATPDLVLAPGDKLTVTLVWQAHQATPTDLKVFVHLLGTDGQMVTQQDNMPRLNTRPTSTWQPGEQIIDRYELTIPEGTPPQTAELLVGMYDPLTGERLAFGGEETAVTLNGVEIRP
jgi:hypothetical protein